MSQRKHRARTPDSVTLLVSLLMAGAWLLITARMPLSLAVSVPQPATIVWAVTLTGSAALALAGLYWRGEVTGLTLELAGRIGLIGATITYAAALVAPWLRVDSAVSFVLAAGVAVACTWRCVQIVTRLAEIRAMLREVVGQ